MSYQLYFFLHLVGVALLIGFTFYAFASPSATTRKWVLSASGIASLLVLAAGLIMVMKMGEFPGWVWVKLVSWIGLSAFAGIAYRRKGLVGPLMIVSLILIVGAIWAVVFKPF